MIHVALPFELTITVTFEDVTQEEATAFLLSNLGDDFEQWLTNAVAEEVTHCLPGSVGVLVEVD